MNQHIQQIKNIYQMLFEMATGNFTVKLQQDIENSPLNELATMLNTVAEKMELLASQFGYINPHYTYQTLVQATIILDNTFTIRSFSETIPSLFEYRADKFLGLDFEKIVAKQSIPLWDSIKAEIVSDTTPVTVVQFIFITQSRRLVPTYCTVSRLSYSNDIIINSITTVLQDMISEKMTHSNVALHHQSDTALIQNVRDYILKNLENPLPSTNELSKLFNINEFKLKDTFRHSFNTSIYQFYIEERLKKAHSMILQTAIPIKQIAIICGYINYINFYKAFKKRFGYTPSDLKRENSEDNNTA